MWSVRSFDALGDTGGPGRASLQMPFNTNVLIRAAAAAAEGDGNEAEPRLLA